MAKQALDLSRRLNYPEGIDESAFMLVKAYTEAQRPYEAESVIGSVGGEVRIRSLLAMSEYYLFKFSAENKAYYKAFPLINKAISLTERSGSAFWCAESSVLLGKYYFKQGKIAPGKASFMKAIHSFENAKDYGHAGYYYTALGNQLPDDGKTTAEIRKALEMGVRRYVEAGKKKEAAYTLRDLALFNIRYKQVALAEQQLSQMLEIFRSINFEPTSNTLYILGDFYRLIGEYDKALSYALKAVRIPGITTLQRINADELIANINSAMGDHNEAMSYYRMVLDYTVAKNVATRYLVLHRLVKAQAATGAIRPALRFLNDFVRQHPPLLHIHQQMVANARGDLYSLLGDQKRAANYYLEMLRLEKMVEQERSKDLGDKLPDPDKSVYSVIGKFYANIKQYDKAKFYLQQSLDNMQLADVQDLMETYQLIFKSDSALGNYSQAIKSSQAHKRLY
ncbi:MAG: tetratricopeptide repeat protein, partial [Pedobacter sp.]